MILRRLLFILLLTCKAEYPNDLIVSATVINTTVTAYIDWLYPTIVDIYDDQVTWFDALGICYNHLQNLEYKKPTEGHRATIVKQALLDANYTGNITLWASWFNPQLGLDRWYRTTWYNPSVCLEDKINFTEAVSYSKQCSVWRLTGTGRTDVIHMSADDCAARHSFMCFKQSSSVLEYVERNDWSYGSLPAVTYDYGVSAKTIQECRESCGRSTTCVSWSFWHDTGECRWVAAYSGYAYITYEIEQSFDNVTHGYKPSPEVTLHPEASSASGAVYPQTFPQCNFSTSTSTSSTSTPFIEAKTSVLSTMAQNGTQNTTPGVCLQFCYCSKQTIYNTSEMEEVVKELIQNLTINKDVTSKRRRKLVSADDKRPSAQSIGIAGIVILSVILAGIVLVDVPRLFHVFDTVKRRMVVCKES